MNTSKIADEAIKEFIELTNIKLSYSRLCLLKDVIQHALIKSIGKNCQKNNKLKNHAK